MVSRRSHPWHDRPTATAAESDGDDSSSIGNGAISRRYNEQQQQPSREKRGRRYDDVPNNQQCHDDENNNEVEYEADYKRNPTELFLRISHRLWDMAIDRLSSHPSEARVWITASYEDESGNDDDNSDVFEGKDAVDVQRYQASLGGIKWRNLPLHLALLHSPHSAPLKLIQALLNEYPNACRCRNAEGSLPLHLACDNYSLVNNGADGEGVLFALVEMYPDALVDQDGQGRTPIDILERVGKGRAGGSSSNGESIMYFMRRQMIMQQEMKRTRERRGMLGIDDGGGTPRSNDGGQKMQKMARNVTAAARAVVSRRQKQRQRSRSLDPRPQRNRIVKEDESVQEEHNNRARNKSSRSSRSQSVDPSIARKRRIDSTRDDDDDKYYDEPESFSRDDPLETTPRASSSSRSRRRPQPQESDDNRQDHEDGRSRLRQAYPVARNAPHHPEASSISLSSDSDYSKLLFNPDDESSGGARADLEAKLAMALRENMSLRRTAEHSNMSNRESEQLHRAMDEIASLRGAIEDLTKNGSDRRHQRMAAAQLESMRKNFDKLEEEMRAGSDRSRYQNNHIVELEAALAKVAAKNSSLQECIEDLREANTFLHERINTSTDVAEEMRSREMALRDKMDRREEEVESIREKYRQAQAVIDDLNAKLSSDKKQIDEYQRKTRCLKETDQQKIDAQSKMIETLKEKVTTLKHIVKKNSATYQKRFDSINDKAVALGREKKALEEELQSAQEAGQQRERRIAELISTKQALREECDELGDRWVESKKVVAEYESQVKALQSDRDELSDERKTLQERIDALASSKEEDDAKMQDMSTQLTASRSQIEGLKDTIKTLETALETKNTAGIDTKQATEAMQKRIQDAEAQTTKVEADNASLRKQMAESKHRAQQQDKTIKELRANFKSLEGELEQVTKDRILIEQTADSLKEESKTLKMKLIRANEDGVKYNDEIRQKSKTIEEQEGNIRQLEGDLRSLNTANDGLHTENERLSANLETMNAAVSNLTSLRDQLKKEKKTLEHTINSMEMQVNASTQELHLQADAISDLQGKLASKERDYNDLLEERSSLEKEVLAGRQLKLENDSLKKAVGSMQDVASEYRIKIQEMSHQLVTNGNESRAKINALKIANKEIQKDVDRLETEIVQYKGAKAGVGQAMKELRAENSLLHASLSSASAQVEAQKGEIDGLNQLITNVEKSVHRVERERDDALLDRDGMHLKASHLEEQLGNAQLEAEKERQSLQANIARLKDEVGEYQGKIHEAEKERQCLQADIARRKDKVVEYQKEVGTYQAKVHDLEKTVGKCKSKIYALEKTVNTRDRVVGINDLGEAVRSIKATQAKLGNISSVVSKWANETGIARHNDSTRHRTAPLKYENLEGLDLAIATKRAETTTTHDEPSGGLYKMTCESVTQISILRSQNNELKRQLEQGRSINDDSAASGGVDDESRINALLEENSILLEETSALKQSLEKLQHTLYDHESKVLNAERDAESYQVEIGRLIDANHTLQSKSADLIKVNEMYKESISELLNKILELEAELEERSADIDDEHTSIEGQVGNELKFKEDMDAMPEEMQLIQTENMALKKANNVLEKALTRLTSRTALHQDRMKEMASMQSTLERQKDEFDAFIVANVVQKDDVCNIAPEQQSNEVDTSAGAAETAPCATCTEERQDGSDYQGERE